MTDEHAALYGTYCLAGVLEQRPFYVKPGTQTVIRYSARHDRWLIDFEGLSEPSILSRLYQWVLNGDPSAASDRCSAYADAHWTDHPGYMMLRWHVWRRSGQFSPNHDICTTTAPLCVRVHGRGTLQDNHEINGAYELQGTYLGFPSYHKAGGQTALRYWPQHDRWVVASVARAQPGSCIAFADAAGAENPARIPEGSWHVFESAHGVHMGDR